MASLVGRNSVGKISIGTPGTPGDALVDYAAIFQFFSIRAIIPLTDATTFIDEPGTVEEAGESVFIATMNGLLKSGAGALPIATHWFPAPQNVKATFQYHTSYTVATDGTTGAWNFEDTLATRGTNTNSVIAGTARSTGVVAVTWVVT